MARGARRKPPKAARSEAKPSGANQSRARMLGCAPSTEERAMPMPKDIGVIDLMIGIPTPEPPRMYDFMRPLFRDKESLDAVRVPGRVHVQGRAEDGRGTRTTSSTRSSKMDQFGIEQAMIGVSLDNETGAARAEAAPRPLHPVGQRGSRTRAWRACARSCASTRSFGIKAVGAFPCGYVPQVPINDKALLPDLREVRRARHPDLLLRRRARARASRWRRRRSSSSTRCAGSSRS